MGIRSKAGLRWILAPVVYIVGKVGRRFPEAVVRLRYFLRFKKPLNLKNPQTLNEKILYMSLRTDTNLWTRLADKYSVRGYIEECGLSDILVPLHGHWESAEEMDFDALPEGFVLKTVQGSGDIIFVRDKSQMDRESVRKKMDVAVKTKYGELEGGKHYMRIKPGIVAEGLLENDAESERHSSSIIDYKVWCFNGKPHYIWVCCNRDKSGTDVMVYDLDWNAHPEFSVASSYFRQGREIPRPANLERMLEVAEKLAKPFPVVRVDLYNIAGRIYFGEMTFTSVAGLMNFYSDEFQSIAGSLIDVNYKG